VLGSLLRAPCCSVKKLVPEPTRSRLCSRLAHARCRVYRTRPCSGDVETSLQDSCFAQFSATQFSQLSVVRTAVSWEPGSLPSAAAACKRPADPGIPWSVSLPVSACRQRADRLELSVSVLSSLAVVTGSSNGSRRNTSQLLKPATDCYSRSPTEQIWPASPRQQKGTFEVSEAVGDSACPVTSQQTHWYSLPGTANGSLISRLILQLQVGYCVPLSMRCQSHPSWRH